MAVTVNPIRILAVNFPTLFREAMSIVLERQAAGTILPKPAICGTYLSPIASGESEVPPPDLLLFDLDHCPHSRLECLLALRSQAPATRILALAEAFDIKLFRMAIGRGVRGVILKTDPPVTMIEAIRRIHRGQIWLGHEIASQLSANPQPLFLSLPDEEKFSQISKREREVLALLGEGFRDQQIAGCLGISIATVRAHLTSVRLKLEIKDRVDLLVYSHRRGLTEAPLSASTDPGPCEKRGSAKDSRKETGTQFYVTYGTWI